MNEFNATADDDQASKLSTDGRCDGSRSRCRSRSGRRNRTMRVSRPYRESISSEDDHSVQTALDATPTYEDYVTAVQE
ncbi:hypothetical protein MRX96_000925 [Rhipicephalus microplus]